MYIDKWIYKYIYREVYMHNAHIYNILRSSYQLLFVPAMMVTKSDSTYSWNDSFNLLIQ